MLSFKGDFGTARLHPSLWLGWNNTTKQPNTKRGYGLNIKDLAMRANKLPGFKPLPDDDSGPRGVISAIIASKRSTILPTLETQPVSMHSLRYAHSLPANSGTWSSAADRPVARRTAASTVEPTLCGSRPALGTGVIQCAIKWRLGRLAGSRDRPSLA